MNGDLGRIIDRFGKLRVGVVGEAMLDAYLHGDVERVSPEAPVPVLSATAEEYRAGGAANAAVNAAALGAAVDFLSVVGDDYDGRALRRVLRRAGVETSQVLTDPARRTLVKRRVVGGGQMLLRIDDGSTHPLSPELEAEVCDGVEALFEWCDAVIVSDYRYGILTPAVVDALRAARQRHPRVLVVDSKDLPLYQGVGVTAVKPNYRQALALIEAHSADGDWGDNGHNRLDVVMAHRHEILDATGAEIAAVTLDRDGALILEREADPYRTYAEARADLRATGAGDTFVAAFALALAAGAYTPTAAELASAAAGVVLTHRQTAACSAAELRAYLVAAEKQLDDREVLRAHVEMLRREGKRIVFTNGCFDILHGGHVLYLNRAKELGDVLVVGVNTDESVARLKGPDRPINGLQDRMQVLAGLSSVDLVIPFHEDTPKNLIRIVRPDLFVKGGDYTPDTLPEAPLVRELGGEVHIMPYLESRSTTSIIDRIRQTYVADCEQQEAEGDRRVMSEAGNVIRDA
ncbi:MAG TPA: D-glycero-beta-D-manno-heptose 1-phosphate adenylyltransferase [Anaerolineae bacterium]|nr:D-glycero-beta-D-manno-heptose 1-phosphate adenylyltransferase [Anaerolineae bacterium]